VISGERTATVSGARVVVEALERLGVDVAFGLPGVHNLPLWRELRESPIRLVGVRHEQTAAYASDGYARASGRLGVALVTTGPGAANTLAAVGEAAACHSPLLVIATDVPAALRKQGVVGGMLHESRDQAALFRPLAKAAFEVGAPEDLAGAVERAARSALAAPAGPVYLGIPTDALSAAVSGEAAADAAGRTGDAAGGRAAGSRAADGDATASGARAAPDTGAVARAADLLAAARSPLIWAGGGAVHADAGDALASLAELLAAPVVTTYQARGLLPPDHPCAAPGPVHVPQIGALWDEADVVLAVGSDLDAVMTQNWAMPRPPALIALNVDGQDASKNWPPDVVVEADARLGAEALTELLASDDGSVGAPARGVDRGALADRLEGIRQAVIADIAQDEPRALELLGALRDGLPPNAVIVADMCIPGYWIGGFHAPAVPRRLAYPLGWGTLGFGLPAAIGSALAHDGATLCVCGDGGFLMACGELATIAQERLPLTILLVDDGGYGMLRYDQKRIGAERFGVDLASPDFAALSEAFGVPAERVTLDGLADALAGAAAAGAPRLLLLEVALRPPPTTSPRWYRTHGGDTRRSHE
jgi:acetolactate synthase-1/2/3 large subunit